MLHWKPQNVLIFGIVMILMLFGAVAAVPKQVRGQSPAGTLYGVMIENDTTTLVAIDPASGAATTIGSFGWLGVAQGVAALDVHNHRYFFQGTSVADPAAGPGLYAVDTQTGAVLSSPAFPFNMTSLGYDSVAGTLYGIMTENGATTLVAIDPTSGGVTTVGSFGWLGVAQGVAALDAQNHRYFFQGSPVADPSAPVSLYTVDTQTGAVLWSPALPYNMGSFAYEMPARLPSYGFSGFLPPVDPFPTFNVAKAGKAIPVKFSLRGDLGLDIFESGYPKSQTIQCNLGAISDAIVETTDAGISSLTYDPAAQQYKFVWKTDKAWARTCRQLILKFKDGSTYAANFDLR